MEELKQEIATVIAKNYSDESIADFFQKYTFITIFEALYNEPEDVTPEFVARFVTFMGTIFRHEKYADQFLFDPSIEAKQLLGFILKHKIIELRQLLPLAIRNHIPKVAGMLDQCDDQTYTEYMGTLFAQLDDESTEVGLKALDIIRKIAKESRHYNFSVVKRPVFAEFLEKGLKNPDSVVMMRYVDLLIEVTNASEEIFQFYRQRGLMDFLVDTYKTNDILVKLTIVESIPKMGDSPWNSKFVNEALVQKMMIDECFDENSDFYVKKNLAILITKLTARGLISFNQKMKAAMANMCRDWLVSGYKEELYGVLDVISNLVLRQFGVEIIFSNEELLIAFLALSAKTDATIKQKFLFTYSQVFNEEMENKLSAYLKKAFSLIGEIEELAARKKTIEEVPTSKFDKSFKWLLKVLYVPFVDIETEALVLLKNVLRFEWSLLDFAKQDNSVAYLTEHVAKSKEIYDMKKEILRQVVDKIEETKTKDIFLLEFRNKLIAGKQNLKGLSDKMSYETDVL